MDEAFGAADLRQRDAARQADRGWPGRIEAHHVTTEAQRVDSIRNLGEATERRDGDIHTEPEQAGLLGGRELVERRIGKDAGGIDVARPVIYLRCRSALYYSPFGQGRGDAAEQQRL